jgi:hypothetical protein
VGCASIAPCFSRSMARRRASVAGEHALVQRCQVHKRRNELEHLPEARRPMVEQALREAHDDLDAARAKRSSKPLPRAFANSIHRRQDRSRRGSTKRSPSPASACAMRDLRRPGGEAWSPDPRRFARNPRCRARVRRVRSAACGRANRGA